MKNELEFIISALIEIIGEEDLSIIFNPNDDISTAKALNAAFLIYFAGNGHQESNDAKRVLESMKDSPEWREVANFYLSGIKFIHHEIEERGQKDPQFVSYLKTLSEWVSNRENLNKIKETAEKFWSVFFPEANGILENKQERIRLLRSKRKATITRLNPAPINDPAQEILFTSNVLLTTPLASKSLKALPVSDNGSIYGLLYLPHSDDHCIPSFCS